MPLLSFRFNALILTALLVPIFFLCACSDLPLWAIAQGKASVTDYQHFSNAPIMHAEQASALPLNAGTKLRLPEMIAGESFDITMERNGTIAFIVLQHGNIIVEHYYNGYQRDSITTSFSVAKSVVSALLGIAIHEKKIGSVEEPITRYVPELLKNDRRFSRIKLRHLLEMRSGILFDDGKGSPWSDAAIFYLTPDLHSKLTALKIKRTPDQAYHYSSGDTQLLALIIQRATGMPLPNYLQEKIWQPMGAAYDASWSLDSSEHRTPKAFCCLNARPIDFARFGLMYLNQGQINGHQIVPAEWVKMSTEAREHATNDAASRWNIEKMDELGTAYYTWYWRRMPMMDPAADIKMRPGADFYAEGLLGQVIYIAPGQDMVIVRVGDRWGDLPWTQLFSQIAQLNPG
ncbi:MAG: serine hydrolase domain-containing protein [Burkholderiaceae bacterium]